jgi:hypothetical protein
MKRTVSIGLLLLFVSVITTEVHAEDKWWQKALGIFKKVDKEQFSNVTSVADIEAAFKEALRIGSENVINRLGQVNGFNGDASVHIPLPDELATVKKWLGKIGMSGLVDDFEVKLNRAAEAATPRAKTLFLQSIKEMSFADVKDIYKGPDDAATRYFQSVMTEDLSLEMRPIIEKSLSEVGAIKAFDNLIGRYESIPFVPDVKASLVDHVVDKGIEGIFFYMAKEEAAIREDPLRQTSDLLKKVFSKPS